MKKGEEDKVILDPNKWSDDQTLNLDKVSISPNKNIWHTQSQMAVLTGDNKNLKPRN